MPESYARQRRMNPVLIYRLRRRARVVTDAIRRFSPSTSSLDILDFGCAEGAALLAINQDLPDNSYFGIEVSTGLLEAAGPLPTNVKLRAGSILEPPADLPRNSFDAVSALAVLEHLPAPDQAIMRAVELLKPGGLFIATCPAPFWDRASGFLRLHNTDGHACELDAGAMTRMIETAGMRILAVEPFMWAPVAILPYAGIRLPPAAALDEVVRSLRIFNWLFVNQSVVARKP